MEHPAREIERGRDTCVPRTRAATISRAFFREKEIEVDKWTDNEVGDFAREGIPRTEDLLTLDDGRACTRVTDSARHRERNCRLKLRSLWRGNPPNRDVRVVCSSRMKLR